LNIENPEAIRRVERAIDEVRRGRMVILVDDEDRENEGDLTMAAELVTPEAITFMATRACGLICVTLTPERVDALGLPMMVDTNRSPLGTAFTVSIEAAEGVSTGISAADRAHTIRVAMDPQRGRGDLISPGHVFPLRAMPGGVLQRTGQTEGSVDLARLAGLTPAGVICEIMRPDGTMARMPDLQLFAAEHGLVVVSIADLIEYRLQRDRLIEPAGRFPLELRASDGTAATFTAHVYRAAPGIRRHEYVALVLGDVDGDEWVPCRGHVACLADDVFGAHTRKRSPSVRQVLDALIRRGRGVLLYLPSRESIRDELAHSLGQPAADDAAPADDGGEIREYGIGAQILLDLGVRRLQVISNNPHKLVGFEAWGFERTEQINIEEV
jgi:3,4-dihydroxy 2-butanone 4-phosphate synthase/GTP cyclohydrolase II